MGRQIGLYQNLRWFRVHRTKSGWAKPEDEGGADGLGGGCCLRHGQENIDDLDLRVWDILLGKHRNGARGVGHAFSKDHLDQVLTEVDQVTAPMKVEAVHDHLREASVEAATCGRFYCPWSISRAQSLNRRWRPLRQAGSSLRQIIAKMSYNLSLGDPECSLWRYLWPRATSSVRITGSSLGVCRWVW